MSIDRGIDKEDVVHMYNGILLSQKKYNKLVNITKKKQTHRYREQTSGYQWGEGRGERQDRGRGLRGTNYGIK